MAALANLNGFTDLTEKISTPAFPRFPLTAFARYTSRIYLFVLALCTPNAFTSATTTMGQNFAQIIKPKPFTIRNSPKLFDNLYESHKVDKERSRPNCQLVITDHFNIRLENVSLRIQTVFKLCFSNLYFSLSFYVSYSLSPPLFISLSLSLCQICLYPNTCINSLSISLDYDNAINQLQSIYKQTAAQLCKLRGIYSSLSDFT